MSAQAGGTRRIVFVADDLGVSPGANEGIAAVGRVGLVREASLCVTGGAVAEGVAVAREAGLAVGLHLSFTLGRSLTGAIRGLTDRDGRFRRLAQVLRACCAGRVDRDGAAREVAAQLERLRQLGVTPTHVNGHHHVHCSPVLRDVVFDAAAAAGVRWTRLPAEHAAAGRRWRPARPRDRPGPAGSPRSHTAISAERLTTSRKCPDRAAHLVLAIAHRR